MKKIPFIFTLIFISICLSGQEETAIEQDTLRKDALNVYFPNASSHLKQEIPFINYVRDIRVADVVIISASEETGSGGEKYTYFLEGQKSYSNMADTLEFSSHPDDTYENTREKMIQTIKMGLMRYILKTPLSDYIDIKFTEPLSDEISSDRWNSWVFSTGVHGFASASESSDYFSFATSASANRITLESKIELDGRHSVSIRELRWTDPDTDEEQSELLRRQSSSLNALYVKSLDEHWSLGFTSNLLSSNFPNYLAHFEFKPGIEYNIFPFSQSTRKQFRFMYAIGPVYNNYCDTTIYFKKSELVGQHSIMAAYKNIQKWGDFNIASSWDNYLHDWDLSRLSFSGSVSLRVAKGLRLSLSGSYAFIHDEINIRKTKASTSDVLLNRRQMATSYSYDLFFSLSYTFGSIYNNTVNPRFNKSGGDYIVVY